jgi:hypothetical protein
MNSNVGSYDAAVRFVVGCGLLALANHGHGWGLAGIALLGSAGGICPLYALLRLNTAACDREPTADIVREREDDANAFAAPPVSPRGPRVRPARASLQPLTPSRHGLHKRW